MSKDSGWGEDRYDKPPKNVKDAVQRFCRECNGVSPRGPWEECVSKNCSLFPYRPGKGTVGRPERTKRRKMSDEHKEKMRVARNR